MNVIRTEYEMKLINDFREKVNERYLIKDQIVKWLASFETKYHLTLSFLYDTKEIWTRKLLNQILKHLNRTIYKNRYRDGNNFMKGIAVRETADGSNTDHYHIMIWENDYIPKFDRLDNLIAKQVNYFNYDSDRKLYKRNYISSYKLQDYFNEDDDGLEGYLTKQFELLTNPLQKSYDSIGILGAGDVQFGRLNFRYD